MLISDDKLKNISAEMKIARHTYSAMIHSQFTQWSLTPSEQEVAHAVIKGIKL
ncbi:hypothetical protein [Pseudoalteromonas sp. 1_MG-2023]|uniref:hypothetical protein n=1 Tax=Pseudoalteromonas sp. 1_MG-2023 TaxID=3062617 RepID=UPI00351F578A